MVKILQVDREAAAMMDLDYEGDRPFQDRLRSGLADEDFRILAFASHREQAQGELVEALVVTERHIVSMWRDIAPHADYGDENRFADADRVLIAIRDAIAAHN